MRRERPAPSSGKPPTPDLFKILLPNAHPHIPRGAASMWERHHQQQQQSPRPTTPSRPQTSGRLPSRSPLPQSPRYTLTGASQAGTLSPRCRSADPSSLASSSPRWKKAELRSPVPSSPSPEEQLPVETNNHGDWQDRGESPLQRASQLPLDTTAREHVEVKSCLLAYMHRIDVESLQQMREKASQEIDTIKAKQILARGGILDDGSLLETTKRRTSFLLRHFFTLGEPNNNADPTKQDVLLHDVIDEWVCRDHASADEISTLWKSIMAHIEHSYVLRRQLVAKADPHALSITIAMDCLRKLPAQLPEYRRVLDVIIVLLESGLVVADDPLVQVASREGDSVESTVSREQQRRFYFEECQQLRDALQREAALRRAQLEAEAQDGATKSRTPLQQLQVLLESLDNDIDAERAMESDKEAVFLAFLRSNIDTLVVTALDESLRVCFDGETPREDFKQLFYVKWMPLLQPSDARRVLTELTQHHLPAFQGFFRENFDAMDKMLMENPVAPAPPTTNGKRNSVNASPPAATTLFHELIERHSTQFASVLLASPYLTAHVFQDSHHLIVRILEQNIVLISHVLQQRPDVLLALFNHTLRDNSSVMEEFLLNHPKALSDLLLNRPAAVAAAVKTHPSILADILQASRSTLANVLVSMPELLCHLFKSSPELLAQTIREDLTILPLAFSLVPQCLSDALERHPEFFVDIAHRKPTLVAKLFAKYPDLLLDPLEANPSVFSNFLVYHRKILPDFSDPGFDPSLFQFERKRFTETGQQTDKRLCKYDGKLRLREKIKFQEDALISAIRQKSSVATTTSSGPDQDTDKISKDSKPGNTQVVLAPGQVVNEIVRLYVKKMEINAIDDAADKKRQPLVDFVLDFYIQELGFKSKAQKKLAFLLTGATQSQQESLRIKWFLKFMNAATSSSCVQGDATESVWSYHPLACEFYLLAMQFLVAVPNDQLVQRLNDELSRPCLVGYTRVKQFLEDAIVIRMLPSKDQRQQLLVAICEKESAIHGASSDTTSSHSGSRTSSATISSMLHLEDVLESIMHVWIQHQDTIRGEWTVQFQLVNPDGSGVVRYNVFADLIRAKMPALGTRAIMKIYHQCEEENDLGECFLVVDDFSLVMSIIQEQAILHQYAVASPSTSI